MTVLDLKSGDRFVFLNTSINQVFEVGHVHLKGKEPDTMVKEIGGKTSDGKWIFYNNPWVTVNKCAPVKRVEIQVV